MKNNFLTVFIFSIVVSLFAINITLASTPGYIDRNHGEARVMTPGLGSLFFNTDNGDVVLTTLGLSGYAWGDVMGWINLDPSGGGVVNDGSGNLSGYAWGQQSGWINFAPTNGGVTVDDDGYFSGYAWAENGGWISFNCEDEGVCGSDDYYVRWIKSVSQAPPVNPPNGSSAPTIFEATPPEPLPSEPEPINIPPPSLVTPTPLFPPEIQPEDTLPSSPLFSESPTQPNFLRSLLPQSKTLENITRALTTASAAAVLITIPGLVALVELAVVPQRAFMFFSMLFTNRRKERPWGIVYDSVTKKPLDPVYVTLKDELGREVSSSLTDLDGRYGFFVPKGTYYISSEKVHYGFPSARLQGQPTDAIYNNLYFGEKIVINQDGEVLSKNIPMDPEAFDWNEFAKTEMKVQKFNPRREALFARLSNLLFLFGFVVSLLAIIFSSGIYNYIVFGLYILLIAIRLVGIKPRKNGVVLDATTHTPLAFASVAIYSNSLQTELFKKITDEKGRYYALVPKGNYVITVSKKDELNGENYVEIAKKNFSADKGVINLDLAV